MEIDAVVVDKKIDYEGIFNNFQINDCKSALFLLMDWIGIDNYLIIIDQSNSSLQPDVFFKQKLIELCLSKAAGQVIIELLGVMKKYKLLKECGICKHQFQHDQKRYNRISVLWKMLYEICEGITNKELQEITQKLFSQGLNINSAEELICYLFKYGKIKENEFSSLIKIFNAIERQDLSNLLTEFCRNFCGIGRYKMGNPTVENCGLAVILNQEEFRRPGSETVEYRRGSHRDEEKLKNLWKDFGFETEVYHNKKAAEILEIFRSLKARDYTDFHCFVACILSHGDKGIVYGSDFKPVKIDDLVNMIANECSTLNGKPKLFFIQACQGRRSQVSATESSENEGMETDSIAEHPSFLSLKYSDVYKAIATIPGFVSLRDPNEGSIFVNALEHNLRLFGDKEDLETVMKQVKLQVSTSDGRDNVQMPITSSTLRGLVIFEKISS